MNNSFYPELYLSDKVSDRKMNKKAVRDTVKRAVTLFDHNKISEETLKALLELAMAWEISTDFEEKIKKKEKSLFGRR